MKKILSYILPMLLVLTGCSQVEPTFETPSQKVIVEAQMPESSATRASLSVTEGSLDLLSKWENGDEVQLIITQGHQKFELGHVPVTDITSGGKRATFSYSIPSGVNFNESYTLYAFCSVKGMVDEDKSTGWYAYCPTNLARTELNKMKAPLYSQVEVTASCPLVQFQHFVSYELLHVKNTTSSDITFRHDGFYVDIPWYRGSANVFFDASWDPTKLPSEWEDEAQSENVNIPAKGEACIISAYLPSGYKMNDATLKAIINGKSIVSSNKKTSSVNIEQAHAYHLYATWNGSELTFDNGDVETEKYIAVSPSKINFGKLAVGDGKSETFTVSNTGTASLTFMIQKTEGDFTIAESGKNMTLNVGESKAFTVVFKPTTPDLDIMQTVAITSDAINGTQYLELYGQSEKERIEQVIPIEIREKMEPYINIYDGSNPPNIEGSFVVSEAVLSHDSKNGFEVGHKFNDIFVRFMNQNMINNTLDYEEKESKSKSSGTGCFISGEGDNFSVFFNTEGEVYYDYTISLKEALVISGTKTPDGIKNLQYAFVIVDKSSDPDKHVMGVGDFRVIIDKDGLAESCSWSYDSRRRQISAGHGDDRPVVMVAPYRR